MKTLVGSTAGVTAALALTLTGCGGSNTSAPSTVTKTVHGSSTTTPQPAAPHYEIVGKDANERFDHEPIYYVVIEPVNLSNDSFKKRVKLVLQAIAKTNGGPDFSANIFDDEAAAKTEYSHRTHPGNENPDEAKAQITLVEQHLVAGYDGGLLASGAPYPYEIMWYPSASTDSPNVGQYVGDEEWKP